MLIMPLPAFAHDVEWHPGPLKQDTISGPAIDCHVVGEYQGHRYSWRYRMVGNYYQGVGDDANGWLASFCDSAGRQDVKGFFKYTEGLEIPDSAIRNLSGKAHP
jgi:hypothetical protein